MTEGFVIPTLTRTAFNCPHCGALAKQFWYRICADELKKDLVPIAFTEEEAASFAADEEDAEQRARLRKWAKRISQNTPFLGDQDRNSYVKSLCNVALSNCFNCDDVAIWIAGRMAYPSNGNTLAPNPDMPEESKFDYREAAAILENSPRGAAALLRLCIQKLSVALGGDGKNLNDDVAALVRKGLDKRIQQALDIVRVTGNNAVHPGEMDLRDDAETAAKLFSLVNLITDSMISQPKQIDALYKKLPPGAVAAINKRDGA